MLRRAAAVCLCIALVVSATAEPVDVSIRRIERFATNMDGDRLAFRGGLVLRGPTTLSGMSALLLDGDRMLAATDFGKFVTARLEFEGDQLVGISDVDVTARRDLDGRPITSKVRGDAESLARGDGEILVYVEEPHLLLAYPADGLDIDREATPRDLKLSLQERRVGAGGMEAMARLPDGRLVLIAEGRDGTSQETPGFFLGDSRFTVRRRDGFAITGADVLPGGDLLLVERRYNGGIDIAMRVRRIGADALDSGKPADGPILLEADFSAEIDNMEAIAAEVRDGRIFLTLASDDNGSIWQRTLLLRFEVIDPLPRPNPLRPTAAAIR